MKTKNAQTLGVHVSDEIVDMIVRRARQNNVSKSKFAAMVFKKWAAEKFPAVSTVDGTARALVKSEMDLEKSKARNPQVEKDPQMASLKKMGREQAMVEGPALGKILKNLKPALKTG